MRIDDRAAAWSWGVKALAGNICRECDETELLESHHIVPKYIDPTLTYEIENGACDCMWLHAVEHKDNLTILCRILLRLVKILTKRLYSTLTPCQEKLFGN